MKNSFIIVFVLATLVSIAGLLFMYVTFFGSRNGGAISGIIPSKQNTTAYQRLRVDNADFVTGDSLVQQHKYPEAIAAYKIALESATNPAEIGQIKYRIADVEFRAGNAIASIQQMKALVADKNSSSLLKAYAVQYLGNMYYQVGDSLITTEVFKDAPYSGFYTAGDTDLSYRKLYEYASSFYPLNLAEARIANWYATQVVRAYQSGVPTDQGTLTQVSNWKQDIKKHLSNAHADNDRTQNDDNNRALIASAIDREAVIVGKMSLVGDTSFGDPESLFKQAIALRIVSHMLPGYTYYNYANFLAKKYGASRSLDIKALLAHLYDAGADKTDPVFSFLKNEKDDVMGVKADLVRLAGIDPDFKKLLVSLGWSF